ncbi:MAG TPA: hypothetical protein VNU28_04105 [Solirubrobacteraceae bacterium]|nr:hypothetical protein [Solirubrobacteraceae bacterium]
MAGLTFVAGAIAVTLSGSPLVVAHTNGIPVDFLIGEAAGEIEACQDGELLPAGISAIRFRFESDAGPRVSVSVFSGGRLLTGGVAQSGWTSGAVTVPVRPVAHAVAGTRVCFSLGHSVENVTVAGSRTSAAMAARGGAGEALPGRFTVEYARAGQSSWWSQAKTVARHIGLGRAAGGTWVALLLVGLMGGSVLAASWLVLRELP